jgi:hypothetical protein
MNISKKQACAFVVAIIIACAAIALYLSSYVHRTSDGDTRIPVGDSGLTRYSDAELGISFLYPLAWSAPEKITGTDESVALVFPGKSLKVIVGSYHDKLGRSLSVPEIINGILEWGMSFNQPRHVSIYQDIEQKERTVDGRPAVELSLVDVYGTDRIFVPLEGGDGRFIDIVNTMSNTPGNINESYYVGTSTADALVASMHISSQRSAPVMAFAGKPDDALSDRALANSTYDMSSWLFDKSVPVVTLRDGIWQGAGCLGGGTCASDRLSARIASDDHGKPEIFHGDLNGDGTPDAVVILSTADDSSLNDLYSGINFDSWERQFSGESVMQIILNRDGRPDPVYSGQGGNVISASLKDGVIVSKLSGIFTGEQDTEQLKLVQDAPVLLSTSTQQAKDDPSGWPVASLGAYGLSLKYPPGFSDAPKQQRGYYDPTEEQPIFVAYPPDSFYEASSTVSDASIQVYATTTSFRQFMQSLGYSGNQIVPKEVRIGDKTAYELPFKGDAAMGTYFNESSYVLFGHDGMLYQFTVSYFSHRIDREDLNEDQISAIQALEKREGDQLHDWLIDMIDSATTRPLAAVDPEVTGGIQITSPAQGARWDQGTLGTWTWSTTGNVPAVAIYIDMASTSYAFTRSYPNHGSFSWTVGAVDPAWNMANVPDGDYRIWVCPSLGVPQGSPACGSFTVTVQGTMPALSLLAPQGGEIYKPGQSIAVTFADPQNGDAYDVYLDQPAKGSDITFKLGSIRATVPGDPNEDTHTKTQTISFIVPRDVPPATNWNIMIIQTSNHGLKCVNACDLVNSPDFTISR